jgi:hypothetical protein
MNRTALRMARPTHNGQWVIDIAGATGTHTLTPPQPSMAQLQ